MRPILKDKPQREQKNLEPPTVPDKKPEPEPNVKKNPKMEEPVLPEDPPLDAKEVAVNKYKKAIEEARANLLKGFDAELAKLANRKGHTVDETVKLIDNIREAKNRFETAGFIPWAKYMWPYVDRYLHSLKKARDELTGFYDPLIKKEKLGLNLNMVTLLENELNALQNARVIAKWRHLRNGMHVGFVVLYSNGRVAKPNGDSVWFYEKGWLKLIEPNPKFPDGFLIITLQVSENGLTYSGTNNDPLNRPTLTGEYVKDN